MRVMIEVTREEVRAVARVLNAEAAGSGYWDEDGKIKDGVLTRLVGQAALLHGVKGKSVEECFARDYAEWRKGKSKTGKSYG